jgi:hypothetical protein
MRMPSLSLDLLIDHRLFINDLMVSATIHFSRDHVVQRFMISLMVVVMEKLPDSGFKISW